MKERWRRALFWSSLGSVVVGVGVALAKASSRPAPPPLTTRPIPAGCTRITLWTRHFERMEDGRTHSYQDRYELQATAFKVWSLLDVSPESKGGPRMGLPVYHVTLHRASLALDGDGPPEQSRVAERFYATAGATDGARIARRGELARGGYLRLSTCRVGGASHGVETGEVHISAAPILNYRLEYGSAAPAGAGEDAGEA